MSTKDTLASGKRMLDELFKQAEDFDQKFKVFTAWAKFQELESRLKNSGMGSGFDEQPGGNNVDEL